MANPFTLSSTDQAIEMLRMVFGSVMDIVVPGLSRTADTPNSQMLAEAFRIFNSGVLMFGSIILTWVTIFGIANTANDGQALGKRWSTLYTPLRTFSAAFLMIPGSSGYAGIQVLMLLIVSWSIGFASTMWSGVVQYAVGTNVAQEAAKSVVKDPNFDSIAVNAIRMTLCASGVNAAMASVSPDSKTSLQYMRIDSPPDYSQSQGAIYKTTFQFADPAWPGSEAMCGKIVMQNTFNAPPRSGSKMANDVAPSIKEAIYQVRTRYVDQLLSGSFTQQIASKVATDGQTIDATAAAGFIEQLKDQQMKEIVATVSQQVGNNENGSVLKTMTDKGWVYAGSMYREIGRLKDAVRNTTISSSDFIPGAQNPLETVLTGDSLTAGNAVLTRYSAVASELSRRIFEAAPQIKANQPTLPKLQSGFTIQDMTDGGGSVKGTINKVFNQGANSVMTGVVYYLEDPDADPIMKVKNLGDWMAVAGETLALWKVTVSSALEGVSGAAQSSTIPGTSALAGIAKGIATFVAELWAFVAPSISTLMYLGYFLGTWIPMVPFLIFATGVIGWLIFVVEMMAAGMLWAAAHTTPAREDSFIGSQTQGYMLVMSGFFRPALMVLGLVASNALLYPCTAYLNEAFVTQFRSLQADSVTGLFSLACYSVIYGILVFVMYMLIFGLPQSLPDNILRWIGAGVGDLGEKGMGMKLEGTASQQARQAAVWAASRGASRQEASQQAREAATRGATQDAADAVRREAAMPMGETGQSSITAVLDE
ncbi:DotA/TraY family protein [Ralstonia pseudosolanacearum]|uniref:DotA/TraY family protein n=1 Tax=Ralstonia pseudosolanacearum TaxID=1310165 RepID=UPI00048C20AA|nr:DotA/TraY family protein [Ralstonia pseudosolanacearum]